ncbi:ABC transporter substrate-binding protein [Pantoea sp. At-9b]|uniref:ABC transporter substrate-binding protein n=1 Tax=Pantoea sp. (strain At-9b) TaxID=592316 RepID=UPI0001B40AFA|nr:ABC transporter substrate-binding protein [Pantoea sp. At-9b]ADU72076.1 NMT1/THI5 like domain protein [Pantoea sp. At-9b]
MLKVKLKPALRFSFAAILLSFYSNVTTAAEKVRVGVITKTYWPTVIVNYGIDNKIFSDAGIDPEVTVYRSGGDAFQAMAAGAADIIMGGPASTATGRDKGIDSKMVGGGGSGIAGWFLVVPKDSTIKSVSDLQGKKVGITSAGSSSDILSRWVGENNHIKFTRVPLGGAGLVPNLESGNVDAALFYAPISYQMISSGKVRPIIDFSKMLPPVLGDLWVSPDSYISNNSKELQSTINAIYKSVKEFQSDKNAVSIIASNDGVSQEVAKQEFDEIYKPLITDGSIDIEKMTRWLDMAKKGGMNSVAPVESIYTSSFQIK